MITLVVSSGLMLIELNFSVVSARFFGLAFVFFDLLGFLPDTLRHARIFIFENDLNIYFLEKKRTMSV